MPQPTKPALVQPKQRWGGFISEWVTELFYTALVVPNLDVPNLLPFAVSPANERVSAERDAGSFPALSSCPALRNLEMMTGSPRAFSLAEAALSKEHCPNNSIYNVLKQSPTALPQV